MTRSFFFLVFCLLQAATAFAGPSHINFESGSVRPLAKSPNGQLLAVTNTVDQRVELFTIQPDGQLQPLHAVVVGLEPVALAFRNDNELWVVNHLSDSISVVSVNTQQSFIRQTLLVGDEPRDLVFANGRAFITTAHRGQHRTHPSIADVPGAGDPLLHDAGVKRADVWVFDANNPGAELGGKPLKIIEMFGDTPRALAVSTDQQTVYAAVFNSGNQTTVIHEAVMCHGFDDTPAGPDGTGSDRAGNEPCIAGNIPAADASASPNGPTDKSLPSGRPLPSVNVDGENQPWTGMIVQFNRETGQWEDSRGLNYSNGVRFSLPDHDVFAIDTQKLEVTADYEHVGTTLFNMAVNPINGHVYISNTEANNITRFEGPGDWGGSTTQGNIARSQITVINPTDGSVKTRHLNRHIDYEALKAPPGTAEHTIATPLQMQVSADGTQLFVAAIGSDKVAVYNTARLTDDALWDGEGEEFDPTAISQNHWSVSGGPSGLVLNEQHDQAYVLSRFNNQIQVINTLSGEVLQQLPLHTPESNRVVRGRSMLYDATRSSSNGEASCASCHVFGDMDHLAWNLGNPDASNGTNYQPMPDFNLVRLSCDLLGEDDPSCLSLSLTNGNGQLREFASMKGPMTTQTMRGMSTHGHLHWRGDRVTGYFGDDTDPNNDGDDNPDTRDMEALDERLSFKNFIVAFEGLLGLDIELPDSVNSPDKPADVLALEADMDRFADFMLSVQMPPNPIRNLDNTLNASAGLGRTFFHGSRRSDGTAEDYVFNGPEPDGVNCAGCHTFDPGKGFYGTDGAAGTGGEIQILKVPQLRNLYQRVGMFGLPNRNGFLPSTTDSHQGDQIRGFGFLHDGATDKLFNFLQGGVFDDGESTCAELGLSGDHFGCEINFGPIGIPNDTVRQGLVDYLLAFESDLAPIVGQQITLNQDSEASHINRLALLESRAAAAFVSKILGAGSGECDLVAHAQLNTQSRGYLYDPATQSYQPDHPNSTPLNQEQMRNLASQTNSHITFTCATPGSGVRVALDRDLDGIPNGVDPLLGDDLIFADGFG